MKKVNTLKEARDHFEKSIDTVTAVNGDETKEISSLHEAEKLYAETTGDSETAPADNNAGPQEQKVPEDNVGPVVNDTQGQNSDQPPVTGSESNSANVAEVSGESHD